MIDLPAWAVVTPKRRAHIERVAALAAAWCNRWRMTETKRARVERAVVLHDALRDAPADTLRRLSPIKWDSSEMLHGPAAAERAKLDGEQDQGVLDAVRYHTVGWAGWDEVGRILYLADYLEPGRTFDQEHRAALAARVPDDMAGVLREVASERRAWIERQGWPILKETEDFWRALVAGD